MVSYHFCLPEESEHCKARSIQFLDWLNKRPEKCIAVVTHSSFLRHLFSQVCYRLLCFLLILHLLCQWLGKVSCDLEMNYVYCDIFSVWWRSSSRGQRWNAAIDWKLRASVYYSVLPRNQGTRFLSWRAYLCNRYLCLLCTIIVWIEPALSSLFIIWKLPTVWSELFLISPFIWRSITQDGRMLKRMTKHHHTEDGEETEYEANAY